MVVVIRGVDGGDKAQNELGFGLKPIQPIHRHDTISCGWSVDESNGDGNG
jgi:hypothetical protein